MTLDSTPAQMFFDTPPFKRTYKGKDEIDYQLIGAIRLPWNKELIEQVQFRIIGDVASIFARLTIVPGGNQWRGMFVEENVLGSNKKIPKARLFSTAFSSELRDQCLNTLDSLRQRHSQKLMVETEEARRLADEALAPISIPSLGIEEDLCETIENSMSLDELNFSRSIRRPSLLSFPTGSKAEDELAFVSLKLATHFLTRVIYKKGPLGTDPHENKDIAYALQLISSRLYDADLWRLRTH